MKIAIYARVSTDRQELVQQVMSCVKFCKYKDFKIGKVYTDKGSGKDYFSRPGYNEMLKDLRSLEYQGIVVFRFDRLGRNTVEAIKFFDEMEAKGIQVYSLNENLDTSSPVGRAIRDFIIRLAQLERENISESTKQRLQALKSMGKQLGRPVGSRDSSPRKKSGYYGNLNASKKRGSKNPGSE